MDILEVGRRGREERELGWSSSLVERREEREVESTLVARTGKGEATERKVVRPSSWPFFGSEKEEKKN